jgi:hypothetical protein
VQAAQAYLDSDDPARAGEMLAAARQTPAPALPAERGLAMIAASRSGIAAAPAAGFGSDTAVRARADHRWIFGESLPGVGAEFLGRQRFKALADLAGRARDAGQPSLAARFAAEALDRSVKDVGSLIGFADAIRVKAVRQAVTEPVRLEPASKAPAKTWLLSIPGEGSARRLSVSPEVVAAGRVIEELGADSTLMSREVSLTIKGYAVAIEGPEPAEVQRVAGKLGGVRGLTVDVRQ